MRVLLVGQKEGVRRPVRHILELRGHSVIERASLYEVDEVEVDAVFVAFPLHGGDVMKLHAKTGTLPMVALVVSDSLIDPTEARLFLDMAERAQGAQGIEDLVETLEDFTRTGDENVRDYTGSDDLGPVVSAAIREHKRRGEPDD